MFPIDLVNSTVQVAMVHVDGYVYWPIWAFLTILTIVGFALSHVFDEDHGNVFWAALGFPFSLAALWSSYRMYDMSPTILANITSYGNATMTSMINVVSSQPLFIFMFISVVMAVLNIIFVVINNSRLAKLKMEQNIAKQRQGEAASPINVAFVGDMK